MRYKELRSLASAIREDEAVTRGALNAEAIDGLTAEAEKVKSGLVEFLEGIDAPSIFIEQLKVVPARSLAQGVDVLLEYFAGVDSE